MRTVVLLFSLLLLILGCGGPVAISTHQELNPWSYKDVLEGTLEVTEPSLLELKLFVENTKSFPFENLYLKYTLTSGLDTLAQELKSFQLQDDLGQWTGDFTGESYVTQFELLTDVKTDQSIQYSIQQYSREDNLVGINSIFLSLESK